MRLFLVSKTNCEVVLLVVVVGILKRIRVQFLSAHQLSVVVLWTLMTCDWGVYFSGVLIWGARQDLF